MKTSTHRKKFEMATGMNIKNGLICVLIIAILTACVPNVAAAPMSAYSTAIHNKVATDAPARQPTTLTFTAPAQVKVNKSYSVYGRLTTASGTGIPGAEVYLMLWAYGSHWIKIGDAITTNSDGSFGMDITPYYKSDYENEVIYYGDMQYAGSISNVVTTTAS